MYDGASEASQDETIDDGLEIWGGVFVLLVEAEGDGVVDDGDNVVGGVGGDSVGARVGDEAGDGDDKEVVGFTLVGSHSSIMSILNSML